MIAELMVVIISSIIVYKSNTYKEYTMFIPTTNNATILLLYSLKKRIIHNYFAEATAN